MIVGPRFGEWIAGRVHVSPLWVLLWPYIHWTIAVGLVVLATQALYFSVPTSSSISFASLPGAVIAVAFWIGFSYLLGTYFRHLGKFNKTYGTLGAAITLMIWFYWTGFGLLVGAELSAELAKVSSEGKLEQKQEREP